MRWVQLQSAGIEPWIERVRDTPDVQFTSAVGAYATQVAELALGLLIAGVRGLNRYARAWTWDPRDEGTLEGSTVAVIGAGGIGRELIRMLEPHDVKILAVTRSGRDGTIPVERIGEIWSQADHFVLCAPATDGTRHLIGAPELWVMKSHSWVINIARGSLIDTEALVAGAGERDHRRRRARRHRPRAAARRPPAVGLAARADHAARRQPALDDGPRPGQAGQGERAALRGRRGAAGAGRRGARLLKDFAARAAETRRA